MDEPKQEPLTEFAGELMSSDETVAEHVATLASEIEKTSSKLDSGLPPDQAEEAKSYLKAVTSAKFILDYIPNFYRG